MRLQTQDPGARSRFTRIIDGYSAADLLARRHPRPASAGSLERIRVPVLVLNGEKDSTQRLRVGEVLQSALPNAERVVIEGAGHLANIDRPDEYNAVLARFLSMHLAVRRMP
jgi:pimeloyl-ACP methyl ester carboxylesterase